LLSFEIPSQTSAQGEAFGRTTEFLAPFGTSLALLNQPFEYSLIEYIDTKRVRNSVIGITAEIFRTKKDLRYREASVAREPQREPLP
jgi:hypothetical protein